MPQTDNPHAVRLYESLLRHTSEQTAEGITHKIALSKSAEADKKFAWAQSICTDLESAFDDQTIREIRMDCACGPDIGKMNSMKKLYQSSADLNAFVTKANIQNQGFTLRLQNNDLLLIYPECYCSCVKRIDQPLSKTWCYCTLGYTKKLFDHVLDRPVDVELLDSVKIGGKECVIKIS